MLRPLALVPWVLIVSGIALLAYAVASGGATLLLVVIVPVLTGGSAAFVGGVLLILAGLFTLPLAGSGAPTDEPRPALPRTSRPTGGTSRSGGVVLVGPVPIFFGSMRPAARRTYWFAVLAGVALTLVALALFWPR